MHSDRILILDHDSKSASLVSQILTGAGYTVITANRGDKAVQLAAVEQPDLLILEFQMPGGMDGLEVARRVRGFSDIPLIFLSSCVESEDMLRGFDAGADDYITKPFDPKILLARLRAVLNRCQGRQAAPVEIVCNNLVINQSARKVTLDGTEIYLTETEYNLLAELARHRNQVLLHEQLLSAVWGAEFHNEVDYLRSYIHILRRKLENNPSQPKMIISRSGVGYMLISTSSESTGS